MTYSVPMEMESRPLDILLVFAILLVALALMIGIRSRRRAATVREQDLLASVERERGRQRVLEILPLLVAARQALESREYIPASAVTAWKAANSEAISAASEVRLAVHLDPTQARRFQQLCMEIANPENTVRSLNETFIQGRLLDEPNPHNLTERQRRATFTDEDTTQIIAGAGTGKTKVIEAKVDYLLRSGRAQPSEILILVYNKKTVLEITERLKESRITNVEVSTFHKLGYDIASKARSGKQSLSSMADDDKELHQFFIRQLWTMLENPKRRKFVQELFTVHIVDPELSEDFPILSGAEQISRIRVSGLQDLTGKKFKSQQEVRIANWLSLHGIAWEYERDYEFSTVTISRRQYKPDFFLPEYGIYIEHWGIDRNGNTLKFIDAKKYNTDMRWKQNLHKTYGTTLVETHSYDAMEHKLEERLETQLRTLGVEPRELASDEVRALFSPKRYETGEFIKVVAQFLELFKGSDEQLEVIGKRAASARDQHFLVVFTDIYAAYESHLKDTNTIDFNDMIVQARTALQSHSVRRQYRYILVDEFQDISHNRLGLLTDLGAQTPGSRLFVVGDDWQSIYRFAGSDVSISTHLAHYVGATKRVDLDVAFRYPQSLLEASSAFIMRNPDQLQKTLRADNQTREIPPLCVMYDDSDDRTSRPVSPTLLNALNQIAHQVSRNRVSVFVLGRYNFGHYNSGEPASLKAIKKRYSDQHMDITFMTVHQSKGHEADFVIVVDLEASTRGFPSNISDDPVMAMVLTMDERFPYAEERRLFYVAMTRARRRIYLITNSSRPSPFIEEDLLSESFAQYVEVMGKTSEHHRCPTCEGRTIILTSSKNGKFWACTNYPLCDGKLATCPQCHIGALVDTLDAEDNHVRVCSNCTFQTRNCPQCGVGTLVAQNGRFGNFLGCDQWRAPGDGCSYTEDIHIS